MVPLLVRGGYTPGHNDRGHADGALHVARLILVVVSAALCRIRCQGIGGDFNVLLALDRRIAGTAALLVLFRALSHRDGTLRVHRSRVLGEELA